jgi:hypothetical protein
MEEKMDGACIRHGELINASMLVGRLEVKRSLGRPRRRWEGNVKIDLK